MDATASVSSASNPGMHKTQIDASVQESKIIPEEAQSQSYHDSSSESIDDNVDVSDETGPVPDTASSTHATLEAGRERPSGMDTVDFDSDKPNQPKSFKFPSKLYGNRTRNFQVLWFNR